MSVANTERPSGAWMIPARRNRWTGAPVMSSPSTTTRPVGGRDEPRGHPGDGGLADAVRPEERHRLAWFDGQLHVEQRTEGAVARRHVVEVEHAGHDDVPTLPRYACTHDVALEDLRRRSLGDHHAEVEDVGALGEAGDELHVVLDEEDREALLGLDLAQGAGQVGRLLAVEPGRRLVEQEHGWLRHQRPTDLDQPSLAEAEVLDRFGRHVAQPQQREDLVAALDLVRARLAPSDEVLPEAPVSATNPLGDQEVLPHGELREELDALERATDAALRATVHAEAAHVLAVQPDRAAVGAEHAEHAVEEGRLAGAVRPDQPDALALLDREVEVVEGDDPGRTSCGCRWPRAPPSRARPPRPFARHPRRGRSRRCRAGAATARRAPRCDGPPAACRSRPAPPDGARTGSCPARRG